MKHGILLVDDDKNFLDSMSSFLKKEGYTVIACQSGDEAVAIIRQGLYPISIALVDYHMPEVSGAEVISKISAVNTNIVVYALSGDDSTEVFDKTLSSGANFFIPKNIGNLKLVSVLERAIREVEKKIKPIIIHSHNDNQSLIQSIGVVGVSESMAKVAHLVHRFAKSHESVLIRGQHGTGKESIARAIHCLSSRTNRPFVVVNCGSIPENLIESELFGHEKGSFTGATKTRKGHFESANGGTIFLDEIGELPKHVQTSLLRVLQQKEIMPVGSSEVRPVDFRLVAATNANLEKMMTNNTFREDLFFRLNVLPINMPLLSERIEDIPILAQHFLNQMNQEYKDNKIILNSTVETLKKLPWVGNVRELENVIKHIYQMSTDKTIDDSYINQAVQSSLQISASKEDNQLFSKHKKSINEKQIIVRALEQAGSVNGASKILNLARTTLRDKMRKYNVIFKNNETQMGEI
jgi:DNA-binding NtrC family response regulator